MCDVPYHLVVVPSAYCFPNGSSDLPRTLSLPLGYVSPFSNVDSGAVLGSSLPPMRKKRGYHLGMDARIRATHLNPLATHPCLLLLFHLPWCLLASRPVAKWSAHESAHHKAHDCTQHLAHGDSHHPTHGGKEGSRSRRRSLIAWGSFLHELKLIFRLEATVAEGRLEGTCAEGHPGDL